MPYTVVITDQHNCTDTFSSYLTVHPDAVLELGENVTLYPGESLQMDPKGNTLYYKWFPPLGLSSTSIANPVAMPDVNTRYFVTGTTEWGCRVVDSIDVIVAMESILDVPNAFTPGSQPNSEIKIIKKGIATLKYFRIFNRWGGKVFETSDIDKGWDGMLNGTPQPMGVYVYVVEANTKTGKRFYKQGNITLIR
jgi:gliding motility-associated-like protein